MPKPKTRLHINGELENGVDVTLSRDQAHFLHNVLRLKSNDGLTLFNSECGEWTAIVDVLSKRKGTVRLGEQLRQPDPEHGPWLAFAPIKKKRMDFIVEKATELGVERLIPVLTQFTDKNRVNVERLGILAIEAAEQCQRLSCSRNI